MTTRTIFLFVLITGFFSCKKEAINEIPAVCYDHEYAFFAVDDTLQTIKEGTFQGASLYYMYGAKPDGEWSVGLESKDYELTINIAACLTSEAYREMTDEALLSFWKENGTYTLKDNPLLQQFFLNDFKQQVLYTGANIDSSTVIITIKDSINTCRFMEVNFDVYLKNLQATKHVNGKLNATIPKKV